MKQVNHDELYKRLKKQAYNSSHYIWPWSDLNFLESSNGRIFGTTKELGVNLVALEPLPPLDEIVTGAHAAGVINIVVTNTDTQIGTLTSGFTYQSMADLKWQVGVVSPAPAYSAVLNAAATAGGTTTNNMNGSTP